MQKKITLLLLTIILNISLLQAQDSNFIAPLAKLNLISTFGELRLNHFHSGIDLSGFHRIGMPVRAIDSGYVGRISISSDGYGNALYIMHNNGLMSVYGHLDHFEKKIQQIVEQKQYEQRRFEITLYFLPGEIPVKRGEVIGYVGNTGRSYAPHLHFEIRDAILDFPYNPLKFDFKIQDSRKPQIYRIAIFPASDTSLINGQNKRRIFAASKNLTLNVYGPIYFGIETYDFVNTNNSPKGVYSVKLLIDDSLQQWVEFDKIFFQHTRYINTYIDYKDYLLHHWKIQRSYISPNNQLCIYRYKKGNGTFNLSPGIHKITYIVSDFFGNTAKFSFKINALKSAKVLKTKHSGYLVHWDKDFKLDTVGLSIFIPQKSLYDSTFLVVTKKQPLDTNLILSPIYQIGSPFVPLQNPFTLAIKTYAILPPAKLVIVRKDEKSHISALKTTPVESNLLLDLQQSQNKLQALNLKPHLIYLQAKSYNFGEFYVTFDTTAPNIRLLNRKPLRFGQKLYFRIKDNLSGVYKYNVYVNDKWTLFGYDAKTQRIYSTVDDKHFIKGLNTVKVIVTDATKNTTEKIFKLFIN